MRRRGSRTAWSVMAFVLLVTSGCTGGSDDAPGDDVVIGIGAPRSLLPTDTLDVSGSQVLDALFYPLVTFDEKGAPVPAAAESVTPDAAARVWTIKLKPGFRFHNDEPVTADNYIDAWNFGAYGPHQQSGGSSFERIDGYADLQSRDPDGPDGPQAAPAPKARTLRGLRKVDDTTFKVTLSGPFAGWASTLNGPAFYPLPHAAFSAPGVLAKEYERTIVGNGPFRLSGALDGGDEIKMTRVAGFPGTAPQIGAVTWKIYRDLGDAYDDLVAGDLDVQPEIPVNRIADARGRLGDRLVTSPNSRLTFVGLPVQRPEFAKREVRRALSLAIDRDRLAEQLFHGAETPAAAFVSPVVPGYRAKTCVYCAYDPAKAKALYTAAGGPAAITIAYHRAGGYEAGIDELCRQITTALGAGCTAAGRDSVSEVLVDAESRRGDLTRMTWTMNYPLMESYLAPVYGTGGSMNIHGYTNPAFDSLVAEGSAASTPSAAVAEWREAEKILAEDMPIIPLFFGQNVYGHSQRVTNVVIDSTQRINLLKIGLK
ncbi:ABC transporter substrate-binding protein [Actinoplanes sp. NPDC049548]|uniref:peptide ABC transporter substrate-binding protein n=1 Tax=Actinoplanes sp. NPDC049548 TaxID=3155152 RepID=UPI00342B4414